MRDYILVLFLLSAAFFFTGIIAFDNDAVMLIMAVCGTVSFGAGVVALVREVAITG